MYVDHQHAKTIEQVGRCRWETQSEYNVAQDPKFSTAVTHFDGCERVWHNGTR